jgi:hypothetical protein
LRVGHDRLDGLGIDVRVEEPVAIIAIEYKGGSG